MILVSMLKGGSTMVPNNCSYGMSISSLLGVVRSVTRKAQKNDRRNISISRVKKGQIHLISFLSPPQICSLKCLKIQSFSASFADLGYIWLQDDPWPLFTCYLHYFYKYTLKIHLTFWPKTSSYLLSTCKSVYYKLILIVNSVSYLQ